MQRNNSLSIKVALCTTQDKMVCEKLKFKITVYFVTSVHRSVLNIVITTLINKQKDRMHLTFKI